MPPYCAPCMRRRGKPSVQAHHCSISLSSRRSGCGCHSTRATSTPSIDERRPKSCHWARLRAYGAWLQHRSPPRRRQMRRPLASTSFTASSIAIGHCNPGQRVTVRMPLRTREESLVVPRAAVLYDAFGGTWVYEARDGGTFVRQRVALADLMGDTAVLRQGPLGGYPRGHDRRRRALRHRVRCGEVAGSAYARTDCRFAAAALAGGGALGRPDGHWHQGRERRPL